MCRTETDRIGRIDIRNSERPITTGRPTRIESVELISEIAKGPSLPVDRPRRRGVRQLNHRTSYLCRKRPTANTYSMRRPVARLTVIEPRCNRLATPWRGKDRGDSNTDDLRILRVSRDIPTHTNQCIL